MGLTGNLMALNPAVIRLASWLCIKQEPTQLAALRRLADDEVRIGSLIYVSVSVGGCELYFTSALETSSEEGESTDSNS